MSTEQSRFDFAEIRDHVEFILSGLSRVPIRAAVWRIAMMTASGTPVPIGLTAGLFLLLIW